MTSLVQYGLSGVIFQINYIKTKSDIVIHALTRQNSHNRFYSSNYDDKPGVKMPSSHFSPFMKDAPTFNRFTFVQYLVHRKLNVQWEQHNTFQSYASVIIYKDGFFLFRQLSSSQIKSNIHGDKINSSLIKCQLTGFNSFI